MIGLSTQSFLRMSSNVNIVFDGNSLVAGSNLAVPSTQCLPSQLKLLDPLNNETTMINVGVGGQDIAAMRARRSAYVDANYATGKKNILMVWEGTNSICTYGKTSDQALSELAGYCSEVLAVHADWSIIILTTLPRFDALNWTVSVGNGHLDSYNLGIKDGYKSLGAKMVIDVRADGTFAYTGPTASAIMAPMMDGAVHLTAAGYGLVAQYCATALRRVSSRS